jgi:hypothetical protein
MTATVPLSNLPTLLVFPSGAKRQTAKGLARSEQRRILRSGLGCHRAGPISTVVLHVNPVRLAST